MMLSGRGDVVLHLKTVPFSSPITLSRQPLISVASFEEACI